MLYVLIFLATLLAVEGLYFLVQGRRSGRQASVQRRLRRLASGLQAPEGRAEESLLRRSAGKGSFLDSVSEALPRAEKLDLLLYRAGSPLTSQRFMVLSAGVALGGWILGSVFFRDPVVPLLLLGLGFLPLLYFKRLARKRLGHFEEQFPEALDLLTRAMRAGHSLMTGLQMVGQELPDPVGTEFSHVAEEIKLGHDVRSALAGLAYRVNTPDLPFFVTAISIQRETGGNLAEILDKSGYVIRERFKLYGKVRALTSIGRASANILAVWPLVMVGGLYVVNRDYVAPLWETSSGHMLIYASLALVIIGYVVCRRMAVIEV
jgi:tight adherence protein B